MKTSEQLLEYNKTHDFDDTVLMFLSKVVQEKELASHKLDGPYVGQWTFTDGSTIEFKEEKFYITLDSN